MDLQDGLLTRRSVRQFVKGKKVPADDMAELLKMAMYAPSAHNAQSWEFIVVDDDKILERIMKVHPYSSFLKDAGTAVIVCGNTEKEGAPGFWVLDSSAAAENFLLGCHAKGLGSCWCGIYPNDGLMQEISDVLMLPEAIKPNALIAVGYPAAEPKQPKDRFKSEKVHHNQW